MSRRRRRKTGPGRNLIVGLILAALVLLILPSSWTSGLISLAQVLVPFQDVTAHALAGNDSSPSMNDPPNAAERALGLENEALQHQLATAASEVNRLRKEVDTLTATRLWGGRDSGLGPRGKLIPARVLTPDLLGWRQSKLLAAGSLQGVRDGDPVVSHRFAIDRGSSTGAQAGMAILLAETLVGYIEQVGTHTSRVKLLADPGSQRKVRLGRLVDGELDGAKNDCWLIADNRGGLIIRDIDRRLVESGEVAIGDLVLSDPTDAFLPAAMTIGHIVRIDPDLDSPLLAIATVKGAVDTSSLRTVYVFDPTVNAAAVAP